MSIVKSTQSGIHAKLTPSYIVTFGYVNIEQFGENVFIKNGHHVYWDEKRNKFTFIFEIEKEKTVAKYEYAFDTYPELKLLEQYWFSDIAEVKQTAYEKIIEKAEPIIDFFKIANNVFTKTISSDLIPVMPMGDNEIVPKGELFWMDF